MSLYAVVVRVLEIHQPGCRGHFPRATLRVTEDTAQRLSWGTEGSRGGASGLLASPRRCRAAVQGGTGPLHSAYETQQQPVKGPLAPSHGTHGSTETRRPPADPTGWDVTLDVAPPVQLRPETLGPFCAPSSRVRAGDRAAAGEWAQTLLAGLSPPDPHFLPGKRFLP